MIKTSYSIFRTRKANSRGTSFLRCAVLPIGDRAIRGVGAKRWNTEPQDQALHRNISGIRLIVYLEEIQKGNRELFREAGNRCDFCGLRFPQALDGTEGFQQQGFLAR